MRRPWKTGEGYAMFWFMSPQTMDFSLLHDWLKMSYYSHAYVNYRWKSCLHFSVCVIVGHGLKASDYELNCSKWYKGFCSFMLFFLKQNKVHMILCTFPFLYPYLYMKYKGQHSPGKLFIIVYSWTGREQHWFTPRQLLETFPTSLSLLDHCESAKGHLCVCVCVRGIYAGVTEHSP